MFRPRSKASLYEENLQLRREVERWQAIAKTAEAWCRAYEREQDRARAMEHEKTVRLRGTT